MSAAVIKQVQSREGAWITMTPTYVLRPARYGQSGKISSSSARLGTNNTLLTAWLVCKTWACPLRPLGLCHWTKIIMSRQHPAEVETSSPLYSAIVFFIPPDNAEHRHTVEPKTADRRPPTSRAPICDSISIVQRKSETTHADNDQLSGR